MHELSLATDIHRLCRARLPDGATGRLERVRVAIGEFSAVEPDLLRYAWEAVTADGPDAGAILEVDWREAVQVCDSCGVQAERIRLQWRTRCPLCSGPLRVEGGRELNVLEFSHAPLPAGSLP